MSIEEQVVKKLRELPPAKQKEVLEFVNLLKQQNGSTGQLRSLRGLWKSFNITLTEKDIEEARREMWSIREN